MNANAMEENGIYPFFTCSQEIYKINTYAFDGEALLVAGNGYLGQVKHYIGKFNAYQRTYVLMNFSDTINVVFMYHYMLAHLKPYVLNYQKEGSVPYITLNTLRDFKLPLPPLPVQEEIVRILDTFSELKGELSSELEIRKIQYKYYRDKLLSFDNNVEYKKICDFSINENQKNKNKIYQRAYSITQKGLIPTSEYFKEAKITSEDTSGYKVVKKHWFVYSPSRIDVGSVNYHKEEDTVIVSPLNVVFSIDESVIYPDYLLYYLKSHHGMWQILTKRQGIDGTGRKLLPFNVFGSIVVPVPSLDVQNRIVDTLDNFDKICTDLNIGLPAEIEARQKEYEFYRNELLSFDYLNAERRTQNAERRTQNAERRTGLIKLRLYVFGCVQLSLKDICSFKYGKGNKIPDDGGKYPVYGCNGIVGYTSTYNNENTPIVGHIGSAGVVVWGEGKHFVTYNGTICTPDENIILSRYLYHLLSVLNLSDKVKGNQPFLSIGDFDDIKVVIPPVSKQEQILSKLEKFDRLCNDLTSGIPAEIEAIQKAYEYHRNKLFSFK